MNINQYLKLSVERGSSDLHLAASALPTMRVNGELCPVDGSLPLTAEIMQEIFESITTENQRRIFYDELEFDFSYSLPGLARFRVNACRQRESIGLTFRCLPTEVPTITRLGLPQVIETLSLTPRGLILVTGRAGVGKSTTLAAMINYLNEHESRKIVTIEDPIEYVHVNKKCFIIQRELGGDTISFASALKHALRQDPDVILVGEMRDLDTISTAITAAETGHLILSTLHTPGVAQSIDRMIDVFPTHQQEQIRLQLALVVEGMISQILLPRADGRSRIAAFEIMFANAAIRNLIREKKIFQIPNYLRLGSEAGMITMDQALQQMVVNGTVLREEALAQAHDPEELRRLLGSRIPVRKRSHQRPLTE